MPRTQDRQLYKAHNEQFSSWFTEHVQSLHNTNGHLLSEDITKLAAGPTNIGRRYKGYCINGFRFRTRESNNSRVTYNSGVTLNANLRSYASMKDKNPSSGDVSFYGELTDVIEVRYTNDIKFVLFKCDWVDNNKGKRVDEFKFTLVNFNHLLYKDNKMTDEPFILASQASQVIYIEDPTEHGWSVVLNMSRREYCSNINSSDENSLESTSSPQIQPFERQMFDESRITHEDDAMWLRDGYEFIVVDENDIEKSNSDAINVE